MNTTSYDIEDHHLELLIPIVGSGCTVLTLFLKGIISKLFPKVNVNDGEDGGGGGVGAGAGNNASINHQQEDADVVLDKLCEPPGIMDQYRYTQIIGDKGEISIRLPPGLTEEIDGCCRGSSVYNKDISPVVEKENIASYIFENKEGGDNYANCDGIYSLEESRGPINKKPIYINKEKDRFLAATGQTGWCITAMQYLDGIEQQKFGGFGGFHGGGGLNPDTGSWKNYNVKSENKVEEVVSNKLLSKNKDQVQGTVSVYREFDDKTSTGKHFLEVELKSVTPNKVKLFIKRFDKDYKPTKKYSHSYQKAKNGLNIFEAPSKIGEGDIEYERVGIMVESAQREKQLKNKNMRMSNDRSWSISSCIIKTAYLKDHLRPRNNGLCSFNL